MSDSNLPSESGAESRDIGIYVRELRDRFAQSPYVTCIRELEARDPDVIIACDVQTRLGWSSVIAVRASADVPRLIGSMYIRTKFPTQSTASDEWLARLQRSAVLMHYTRAQGEPAIEAQARLPIFADRAISEAIESAIEPIIRLQGFMLVDSYRDRLRAQHAIWAMGPLRLAGERLQVLYEALRDAIARFRFRLVELDTGCVVINGEHDVPRKDVCRVEMSINFKHELFGSLICAELVVPWAQSRGTEAHEAATLLNRSDQASEDEALGVGAWYVHGKDGSLRYRILLPITEQWSPCLDVFVSSLVIRWLALEEMDFAVQPDLGLAAGLQSLFSSMRSSDAIVSRVEQIQGRQLSMDDYYRDVEARKLVAQMAGISVTTVNRYLGPQPRRPLAKGRIGDRRGKRRER
jgi:hypothetical protein